ncbi:MAG: leucine-rich repeat domain-containing protein [Bacilli bacterium]|nr:leucine-rich repeat domain-containing protein [Bacilli bacterium]
MSKKIYLALGVFPLFMSTLVGCSSLHVHTIDSPYEANETSHWKTCKICHEKFDEHEHTWNEFNDTCFICEYHDPLVRLEGNVVVGLTAHGMNKLTFDIPNMVNDVSVKGIAPGAFAGSKAVTVKLNRDLDYYYADAFAGSNVKIINSEEGDLVQWVKEGDKMVKHRDFEAMIDNHHYKTLAEAFDAVEVNDATITLLKDVKVDSKMPIKVNHSISLVAYQSSASLECNFNIVPAGILYIPETITYQGDAKLLLGDFKEKRGAGDSGKDGNTTENVYNTGSLVFTHKEERPDNVNVNYVESFGEGVALYPAVGAKQVVNDLLVVPVNHYAFGTLRFSKDFSEIKGLTEYGQTVTHLNITNVVEGRDANIGERSFSIAWDLKVPVAMVEDTHYYCFVPKGLFLDLTIGDGIKVVKKAAFNNRIDSDIDREIINYLYPVFSHLFSITIGDTVEEIQYRAFYDSVALASIGGGKKLKKIGESAFEKSMNLVTVDFEHSALSEIKSKAFADCRSLSQVILPEGSWKFNSDMYFPYDMTPERIAYFIANSDGNGTWTKSPLDTRPVSYTTSTAKDSLGRFKKVKYVSTISEAINSSDLADGGEIYISEKCKEKNIALSQISKSLTINVAPELKDITVGNENGITVNAGKYLALYNAKPNGDITLKANKTAGAEEFKNVASFAIKKGVDMEHDVRFEYEDNSNGTFSAISNEVVIREKAYNAYGLFDFSLTRSDNTVTSHLIDLTNLGKSVTTITFGRQIELAEGEVSRVHLQNGQLSSSGDIAYVFLSDEVINIGVNFFNSFTKLQEVILGNGITNIAEGSFQNCTNLRHVVLPDSLTSIGESAFKGCTSLLSVNIPDRIASVPKYCFDGCTSLSSVSLSDSGVLTNIWDCSFRKCENLTSINIPGSVKIIHQSAFSECTSLSEITFEEDDKNTNLGIYESAFAGCTSLVSISFPSRTSGILTSAFANCTALESVYLPDDNRLGMIFNNAFVGCTNLTSFHFGNNIYSWMAGSTFLSPEDLSNDSTAAKYLTDTYINVDWQKRANHDF